MNLNWNPIQDISSQHYHLNATSQTVWMLGMEVWSSEGLDPRSSPQIESSSTEASAEQTAQWVTLNVDHPASGCSPCQQPDYSLRSCPAVLVQTSGLQAGDNKRETYFSWPMYP
ncbi:hypothetical protein U0070_001262 [Myodes glareolus]|uniref:Uncharacterized protein n=1 Tax=Myodes glareolus TaxID=447135 RepID=A0AAW0HEZ6_MYOGA